MSDLLQTEFAFTLPKGYDDDGTLHREGTMRLATAADELDPLCDPRVQRNPPYLTVLLLARVITKLGTLSEVTPEVVEKLFVADIAHLQELYERVNERGSDTIDVTCPDCGEPFEASVHGGESTADGADHAGNPSPSVADPWVADATEGATTESDATTHVDLREGPPESVSEVPPESEVPPWE